MKVLVAMDSFKESLTAMQACQAVADGFKEGYGANCAITCLPMADGGEGTVEALVAATKGKIFTAQVHDPLLNIIEARYGVLGDGKTAVIEMAAASGLALVPMHLRNPLHTSSYGTGELILAAINNGVNTIILGIGGSATNDGGAGMAAALGVQFSDKQHQLISHPTGGKLADIHHIDLSKQDERLNYVEFFVACDVDNPLTGPRGASVVFGPQKGADEAMVKQLDANLAHYAQIIEQDLGKQVAHWAGAGAAGGLGAGTLAFLPAVLESGVGIVMQAVGLVDHLQDVDLVITGEGRIDGQTVFGKTPMGVAKLAKVYNKPVIGLCGCLGEGYEAVFDVGIDTVIPILSKLDSLENVLANGYINLSKTSRNVARLMNINIKH